MYASAGVAGQFLREVAQHFRCHEPAQTSQISCTPGFLDGLMERLKGAEVGVGQIYVVPAIAPDRGSGRSDRTGHRERRPAGPSARECAPTEQPQRKIY